MSGLIRSTLGLALMALSLLTHTISVRSGGEMSLTLITLALFSTGFLLMCSGLKAMEARR